MASNQFGASIPLYANDLQVGQTLYRISTYAGRSTLFEFLVKKITKARLTLEPVSEDFHRFGDLVILLDKDGRVTRKEYGAPHNFINLITEDEPSFEEASRRIALQKACDEARSAVHRLAWAPQELDPQHLKDVSEILLNLAARAERHKDLGGRAEPASSTF